MARIVKRAVDDGGNVFLESILWKDVDAAHMAAWNDASIKVYFDDTAAHSWTAAQKTFYKDVLGQWSVVTHTEFQIVNATDNANFIERIVPQEFFGAGSDVTVFGAHETPSLAAKDDSATGWFWEKMFDPSDLTRGSFAYETILHELGHALGLAHPHDNGGGSSVFPTDRYDHVAYTIMSYNDSYSFRKTGRIRLEFGELGHHTQTYGFRIDPAAFDIEAIQAIYGVKQAATGDNVYTLSDKNSYWTTPWDTGGKDTLRYDGDARAVIDLRPASMEMGAADAGGGLSYVEGVYGGVTMASDRTVKTAVIENAIGGNGDDTITGNDANNRFTGNGGDDVIDGGAGAIDIARLRGAFDDYWIRILTTGWTLMEQTSNKKTFDDGFDRLRNVEYLHFTDGYASLIDAKTSPNAREAGGAYEIDGERASKVFALLLGFEADTDVIVLKGELFDGLDKGALDADQFTLGAAKDADDRLIFDAEHRGLYFDADGAGGAQAVLIARFGDMVDLSAGDILVV